MHSLFKQKLKGFTLIEILIVVIVVGLLSGVAVWKLGDSKEKAAENFLKSSIVSLERNIDHVRLIHNTFPEVNGNTPEERIIDILNHLKSYDIIVFDTTEEETMFLAQISDSSPLASDSIIKANRTVQKGLPSGSPETKEIVTYPNQSTIPSGTIFQLFLNDPDAPNELVYGGGIVESNNPYIGLSADSYFDLVSDLSLLTGEGSTELSQALRQIMNGEVESELTPEEALELFVQIALDPTNPGITSLKDVDLFTFMEQAYQYPGSENLFTPSTWNEFLNQEPNLALGVQSDGIFTPNDLLAQLLQKHPSFKVHADDIDFSSLIIGGQPWAMMSVPYPESNAVLNDISKIEGITIDHLFAALNGNPSSSLMGIDLSLVNADFSTISTPLPLAGALLEGTNITGAQLNQSTNGLGGTNLSNLNVSGLDLTSLSEYTGINYLFVGKSPEGWDIPISTHFQDPDTWDVQHVSANTIAWYMATQVQNTNAHSWNGVIWVDGTPLDLTNFDAVAAEAEWNIVQDWGL